MNKTKRFINAINKKLKLAHIEENPRHCGLRIFEVKLNPSPYFSFCYFNYTDAYKQLIENTVLEFYNDVPCFNNTGSTFWFDDKV